MNVVTDLQALDFVPRPSMSDKPNSLYIKKKEEKVISKKIDLYGIFMN